MCHERIFRFIKSNLKLSSEKFAAICGYLYNPIHKKYLKNKDTFVLEFKNFCPWGYCMDLKIWSNYMKTQAKFDKPNIIKNSLLNNIRKISNRKKIWTLGFMTFCKIKGYNFLYPSRSLIKNIGFDGSGQNSKLTNKFDTEYRPSKISRKLDLFSKALNQTHENFLKIILDIFTNECFNYWIRQHW